MAVFDHVSRLHVLIFAAGLMTGAYGPMLVAWLMSCTEHPRDLMTRG